MSVVEPTSEGAAVPSTRPSTFPAFYEERLAVTVRQVALMVGSAAAAEDIAHDAFIEVYRRWDELANPGGYLYRCVSNGALRHLKRGNRHGGELVDLAAPAPSLDFLEVVDLLGHLTPRQRVAVVLKHYGDLTEQQIADALGCRPGSVGPLLTRAHAALREEWGE